MQHRIIKMTGIRISVGVVAKVHVEIALFLGKIQVGVNLIDQILKVLTTTERVDTGKRIESNRLIDTRADLAMNVMKEVESTAIVIMIGMIERGTDMIGIEKNIVNENRVVGAGAGVGAGVEDKKNNLKV